MSASEFAAIWRRDTYCVEFLGERMTQAEKDRHALLVEVERLRALAGSEVSR